MPLWNRLRAIIRDRDVPGSLVMKACLATFPNTRALETFFKEAGVEPDQEFEALNSLLTLRNATLSVNPWLRANLASFFKLTGAHLLDDRHARIALSSAYREYMTLKDRAVRVFAQFAPGGITPEEVGKVAGVAVHISDEYLYELGLVRMHEEDTLFAFLEKNRFPIANAYEDGVPADMFLALHVLTDGKTMKALAEAGVPAEDAKQYISAGLSGERAVECWREGIPAEYAAAI